MVVKKSVTRKKTAVKKKTSTKPRAAGKKSAGKAVAKKKVATKRRAAAKKPAAAKPKQAGKRKPVTKSGAKARTATKKPAAPKKSSAPKKPSATKVTVKKKAATKRRAAVKKPAAAKPKQAGKRKPVTSKSSQPRSQEKILLAAKEEKKKKRIQLLKKRATATLPVEGIPAYTAHRGESYMSPKQLEHFRNILLRWKQELLEEVSRTVDHMKKDASQFADPADRATQEEEFSLELRTRDREGKLVRKINQTLAAIDADEYGYCEACGVEIGIKRLEARPTATLCIDCKTLQEIKEKQNYT